MTFRMGTQMLAALMSISVALAAQETPPSEATPAATESAASPAAAAPVGQDFYAVALLPFQDRGREVEGMGVKVSDLLFANLITNPSMFLVEREDIGKLLTEQELNLTGIVNPAQATQLGQLTGAKIIVTGSVVQVGNNLYVVAKIIGTESTRVLGASVKGGIDGDLDALVQELANSVGTTISDRSGDLIPKAVAAPDRIAELRKTLGDRKRPTVVIRVAERHIGQPAIDPAAETELAMLCTELGFRVIDPKAGNPNEADVDLTGEGFSEFGARHGNLASVKARLELKAVDRKSGRVIAVDRQVSVSAGLAEQIAAKTALQDAAASIASRLLPKVVEAGAANAQ